jgi:hypothetical protein
MSRTSDTERLNRARHSLPATRRRALLSLSWYSSVPGAEAHQTLSRVSVPRKGGSPGFRLSGWLASRSSPAAFRSAWHAAHGSRSVVGLTRADVGPRRESRPCGLHFGTSLEHQGSRMLVALHGPQDTHGPAFGGHASDASVLGAVEFAEVVSQNGLMPNQGHDGRHQDPPQIEIDVSGLDDTLALTLAPARARIVATTDQAGGAKDAEVSKQRRKQPCIQQRFAFGVSVFLGKRVAIPSEFSHMRVWRRIHASLARGGQPASKARRWARARRPRRPWAPDFGKQHASAFRQRRGK